MIRVGARVTSIATRARTIAGGNCIHQPSLRTGAQLKHPTRSFIRSYATGTMSADQLAALEKYCACDVADALLKLDVPGAGFLPDISPAPHSATTKVIAPASTVLFTSRATPSFPTPASGGGPLALLSQALHEPLPNIPAGAVYADLTQSGTVVVLSQPVGQACAVMGGIMAVRMRVLGARAVLVDGRVRDLEAVRTLGIPVWARGTSIVGAGAEAKPWAVQVPVQVQQTVVHPGDIIMIDPSENGAVCIPIKLLDKVLELMPRLVEADVKVVDDVTAGSSVQESFKKYRAK